MSKPRRSCATKFLWVVAIVTMIVIAGAILYRVLEARLFRWALVPSAEFVDVPMPDGSTYRDAALWIARPDLRDNPSTWLPSGIAAAPGSTHASIFFIHPTSFLERDAWNAPLDHGDSRWRAELFVRSQSSAFTALGPVWAPRYRQATFGAFLTGNDNARRALDLAYGDVLAAFEQFLREAPADLPIVLAGHSQGSLHLLRLLQERLRGRPEAQRIAAAYVIGWPISLTADAPTLPLPPCRRAGQPGCVLSWMSFADPAAPEMILERWNATSGPTGVAREGTDILCVNPLSGNVGDTAPAAANRGTLVPNDDLTDATMVGQAVPARCGERGFLLIGDAPPDMGPYVLPGNNYHVYDYALFWANIRADAAARVAAFDSGGSAVR